MTALQKNPLDYYFSIVKHHSRQAAMNRDDYRKRITLDPRLKKGEPCVHGLPVKVYEVVSEIIAGTTWAQLLAKYPQLQREDILACLIFAAEQPKPLLLLQDEDLWP